MLQLAQDEKPWILPWLLIRRIMRSLGKNVSIIIIITLVLSLHNLSQPTSSKEGTTSAPRRDAQRPRFDLVQSACYFHKNLQFGTDLLFLNFSETLLFDTSRCTANLLVIVVQGNLYFQNEILFRHFPWPSDHLNCRVSLKLPQKLLQVHFQTEEILGNQPRLNLVLCIYLFIIIQLNSWLTRGSTVLSFVLHPPARGFLRLAESV